MINFVIGLYMIVVCVICLVVAVAERKIQNVNQRSDFNRREGTQSRANTFRHHISKVTCGGIDGAYYTSTRTRRKGSGGVSLFLFSTLYFNGSFYAY